MRRVWGGAHPVGLVAVGLLVASASGCWGQVGQGPDGRAHNPFETAISTGTVAGLEQVWSAPAAPTSQPVSSGSTVFVHGPEQAYAYAASDGDQVWAHTPPPLEFGTPVSPAQPLVDGGRVMVPWRFEPRPYAGGEWLDAATGEVLEEATGPVTAVRGGWQATETASSNADFSELSFGVRNTADPDSAWGGTYVGGLGGFGTGHVTLGRDRVYVAVGTTLDAYPLAEPPDHPATPDEPWTKQFDWRFRAGTTLTRPVLSEDGATVYVADSAGELHALDAATGATSWSVDLGAAATGTPAFDGTTLFVPTAADELVAVDVATHAVAWTAYAAGGHLQPAVAGRGPGAVVFVAVGQGNVAAYAAAGCGAAAECPVLWWDDAGDAVTGAPAVANGRLFVTTAAGRLVAFGPAPP